MRTFSKLSVAIACLIVSLGMALPALAHHGFAVEYDRSKQLTLVGTLARVQIENPHGWLFMNVKDAQGNVVSWALELPGPAALRRNGYDSNIFQTLATSGEVVTVKADAARDGSKHAFGESLTRADGQTVIPLGRPMEPGRGGYGNGGGRQGL